VLNFYKQKNANKLWKQEEVKADMMLEEDDDTPIFIENLPSHARLCINVILIPEWVSNPSVWSKKPGIKSGFVLGSCQISLFDESYLLR